MEALVRRADDGICVGPLPYGREPFYQLGPGERVYWNWSDALRVSGVRLDGSSAVIVDERAPGFPVGQRDLDRLLGSYEESDSVVRRDMREAMQEEAVPKTKPALRALVVDDLGRIWVGKIGKDDYLVMRGGVFSYTSPSRMKPGLPPSP